MSDEWRERLEEVFASFASFGVSAANAAASEGKFYEMDNKNFTKLCRETGLVSGPRDRTNPDIVFAQVKPKGGRKINFQEFVRALAIIAHEKGVELDAVESKVIGSGVPLVRGTQPEDLEIVAKLTDTTIYPASHKHRFDADGKGRGKEGRDSIGRYTPPASTTMSPRDSTYASPSRSGPSSAQGTPRGSGASTGPSPAQRRSVSMMAGMGLASPPAFKPNESGERDEWEVQLEKLFESFASFGAGSTSSGRGREMDCSNFTKLCRDCGLVDRDWPPNASDVVFAKVRPLGGRRINLQEFRRALEIIAEEKGVTVDAIESKILGKGTPLMRATQPEALPIVEKLTDPSYYTASHRHRFDADGKGRGKEGRDVIGRTDRVCK